MTEKTLEQNQPKLHPVAQALINFVNEALTMTEIEARLDLIKQTHEGLTSDLARLKEDLEKEPVEGELVG